MSEVQIQNFRLFKRLLLQLKNYGLNPSDWRIERATWKQDGLFDIRHRKDRDFRFQARWTRTPRQLGRLTALELASI